MPKTKEINPYAAKENAGHTLHHFGGRAPSPRDGPFSVFAPSTTTTGSPDRRVDAAVAARLGAAVGGERRAARAVRAAALQGAAPARAPLDDRGRAHVAAARAHGVAARRGTLVRGDPRGGPRHRRRRAAVERGDRVRRAGGARRQGGARRPPASSRRGAAAAPDRRPLARRRAAALVAGGRQALARRAAPRLQKVARVRARGDALGDAGRRRRAAERERAATSATPPPPRRSRAALRRAEASA